MELKPRPVFVKLGIPEHWAEYTKALVKSYAEDMRVWNKDLQYAQDKVDGMSPWERFRSSFTLGGGPLINHLENVKMQEPWRKNPKYEPTIIGYFNWVVEERELKANADRRDTSAVPKS